MLYEGARMLMEGKDCKQLGLMHGAEVVIEKVILNAAETYSDARENSSQCDSNRCLMLSVSVSLV